MNRTKNSCQDFIQLLASKSPVPGGGGASAFVGAIGTALGRMVGSLTEGKKKYADVQEDILSLILQSDILIEELMELIQKDALVFEPLAKAYGMPRQTDEEKAIKAAVMEEALKAASEVPFELMEKCCRGIELHGEFAKKGSVIAISDVGCGVICLKSALMSASLNVFINTKSMADREYAEKLNHKADYLLETYTKLADTIYTEVLGKLR